MRKWFKEFDNINIKIPDFSALNIFFWFKPETVIELTAIKHCIDKIIEKEIREFLSVVFSNTGIEVSGTRKGEFKLYRIPLNEWEAFNPDTFRTFSKKVSIDIVKMAEFVLCLIIISMSPHALVIHADSRKIFSNEFPEEGKRALYSYCGDSVTGKVNLIVTSTLWR